MTDTTADTLRKAKALISDSVNWNQDGDFFKGGDPETNCMCAYGACMMATGKLVDWPSDYPYAKPLEEASDELFGFEVVMTNDNPETTHEEIMRLFDRAIELAEEQQQEISNT